MPIVLEDIVDDLELIDLAGAQQAVAVSAVESVVAADAATPDQFTTATDRVQAASAAGYGVAMTATLSTRAALRDSIKLAVVLAPLVDYFVLADQMKPETILSLKDTLRWSETWSESRNAMMTVTERAQLKDRVVLGRSDSLSDSLLASDAASFGVVISGAMADALIVSDGFGELSAKVRAAIVETAHLTTAAENSAVTHGWAIVDIVAFSEVDFANPNAEAWVMQTESTAMSRYLGYDFDSVAQYKGVIYGVNRDGLFSLHGDKDLGLTISALIETGFMDFGIFENKRIPNVYMGFVADGQIQLTVQTMKNVAQKFTYRTPILVKAKQPVNARIDLGKGLVSDYWKFTVSNKNGSYFDLDKWSADVAISARRI